MKNKLEKYHINIPGNPVRGDLRNLDSLADSSFTLENAYRKLRVFTKSAFIFLLATTAFQFLILSLGIPAIITETESQEFLLNRAIIEEESIEFFRNKAVPQFDNRLEELVPRLVTKNQPEIIKAARSCKTSDIKSILSRDQILANATNNKLETALHWVARRNCLDAAKILLAYHANPNIKDKAGRTPVDWAENSYNMDMLRLLSNNR